MTVAFSDIISEGHIAAVPMRLPIVGHGARSSVARRLSNSEGATKVPRVTTPETLLTARPGGRTWDFL